MPGVSRGSPGVSLDIRSGVVTGASAPAAPTRAPSCARSSACRSSPAASRRAPAGDRGDASRRSPARRSSRRVTSLPIGPPELGPSRILGEERGRHRGRDRTGRPLKGQPASSGGASRAGSAAGPHSRHSPAGSAGAAGARRADRRARPCSARTSGACSRAPTRKRDDPHLHARDGRGGPLRSADPDARGRDRGDRLPGGLTRAHRGGRHRGGVHDAAKPPTPSRRELARDARGNSRREPESSPASPSRSVLASSPGSSARAAPGRARSCGRWSASRSSPAGGRGPRRARRRSRAAAPGRLRDAATHPSTATSPSVRTWSTSPGSWARMSRPWRPRSSRSASRGRWGSSPSPSPAGSAAAPRWRWRCSARPSCWSSTSPPSASTPCSSEGPVAPLPRPREQGRRS